MAPAVAQDEAQQTAPVETSAGGIPSEMEVLIRSAAVLSEPEKQYWLDLLPSMDEPQLEQLRMILGKSQEHMQDLNTEYDGKMKEVSEKLVKKWDSQKTAIEREVRAEEEAKTKVEADVKAEELLEGWE